MSFISQALLFSLGALIGHVLPRFPVLVMSRGRGFNVHFPPHPEPMPLGPHLNQRILHLRTFHRLGLIVVLVPMIVGLASVRWGNSAFGFGLWLSAGWFFINRLQSILSGQAPWTREIAEKLQGVMNRSTGENQCCAWATPVWGMTRIHCSNCGTKLLAMARPDLGRKRSDGRIVGTLRLLISDGYPMVAMIDNGALEEE